MTDEQLFEDAMCAENQKIIWGIAKIATGDSFVADDIVQEVILHTWRHWEEVKNKSSPIGYLKAETRQKIAQHYRKKRPILTMSIDKYDEDADDDTLEMIMERENKRELLEAINTLPFNFKQVILLHYFEDMSIQSIADMLNLKYGAICYRNKTGLAMLRKKLNLKIDGGPDGPGRSSKMTLRTFILMFGVWEYA